MGVSLGTTKLTIIKIDFPDIFPFDDTLVKFAIEAGKKLITPEDDYVKSLSRMYC